MRNWIIYFILTFIFFSCKSNNDINYCKRNFFNDYTAEDSLSYIFKIGQPEYDSICKYNYELNFWVGTVINKNFYPDYSLEGKIFYKSNKIYLIPIGTKDTVVYLNFLQKLDEPENCEFRIRKIGYRGDTVFQNMGYKRRLLNKFYDYEKHDTIFKVRFENIGIMFPQDYLVMFVGIRKGLIGIFHGVDNEILSARGYIYGLRISSGENK